jgi:hypothetical protein
MSGVRFRGDIDASARRAGGRGSGRECAALAPLSNKSVRHPQRRRKSNVHASPMLEREPQLLGLVRLSF